MRGAMRMGGLRAEDISTILVGLSLFVAWLWGGSKGKQIAQGKTQSAMPQDVVEVAGAIVSDKAVERMVKSLDAFTAAAALMTHSIDRDVAAKGLLTSALTENSRALDRNSDVAEDMREEIRDAASRMEQLKTELIRSSR